MKTLSIGQRVSIVNFEGKPDITGEVRGTGTIVLPNGDMSLQYIILLDQQYQGYVLSNYIDWSGKADPKAPANYITHILAEASGVSPLSEK